MCTELNKKSVCGGLRIGGAGQERRDSKFPSSLLQYKPFGLVGWRGSSDSALNSKYMFSSMNPYSVFFLIRVTENEIIAHGDSQNQVEGEAQPSFLPGYSMTL